MREKPAKASAQKRLRRPSVEADAAKRQRQEVTALAMPNVSMGVSPTPATAWQAALNPMLSFADGSMAASMAHSFAPASMPLALQGMAEMALYGDAWAAAREHHLMLLVAEQRGVPITQATPPARGFASTGARKPLGSQGAKKSVATLSTGARRLCAALRSACAELDVAVVSQLLLAGADAGAAGSDGRTAAHALAEAAHGTQGAAVAGLIANMLLRHGAQLDVQDSAGATPLHLAADAPAAAVLLAAAAPVNAVNNAAETPLFGAAAAGATGLIRVLARHGANLDQQDDCGETALIRACSREDATEAVLCLLEVGATVAPVDGAGRTALHAAAEAGNGMVVSALLAHGAAAQIRVQDAAGDTPLVLAGRNGHAQVAAQLMSALGALGR